jgi:hypothetical protein
MPTVLREHVADRTSSMVEGLNARLLSPMVQIMRILTLCRRSVLQPVLKQARILSMETLT